MTERISSAFNRETLVRFLQAQFRVSNLHAVEDENKSILRFWLNIDIPGFGLIPISLLSQGAVIRFTAHRALMGKVNAEKLKAFNEVNLSPWGGRIYLAPDNQGGDISFGVPLPENASSPFPVGFYISQLCDSVVRCREGDYPRYIGPEIPSVEILKKQIVQWAQSVRVQFANIHDGHMVVFDTYTLENRPVRVEIYVYEQALCSVRVHEEIPGFGDRDFPYDVITTVNQLTSSGAVAWQADLRRLVVNVVQYPAVVEFGVDNIQWAVDRALEIWDKTLDLLN